MTCIKCGTIYPVNHSKCPKCKSSEAKQIQYKTNKSSRIEIIDEPIDAMVVSGEISLSDAHYQS